MKCTQKCVILPYDRYQMLLRKQNADKIVSPKAAEEKDARINKLTEQQLQETDIVRDISHLADESSSKQIQDQQSLNVIDPIQEGGGDQKQTEKDSSKDAVHSIPTPGLPKSRKRRKLDRNDKDSWKNQWVSI